MEKINELISNLSIPQIITISIVLLILVVVNGCAGWKEWKEWKDVVKPPTINPILITDTLYQILEPKIKENPTARQAIQTTLTQLKSKTTLINDGAITISDAFDSIIATAPDEYKSIPILMKGVFISVYGDFGKEIPKEQIKKISTINKVIHLLESKLSK